MSSEGNDHGDRPSAARELGVDSSADGLPERRRPIPVSALFDDSGAVARALPRLTGAGVPRDLIEVVVSPAAASRFYAGVRPVGARQTVRFAGIGGLTGLGLSIVLSLVMISLPDFVDPGARAVVQLLGPNMGAVGGATVGALIGFFRRRPPRRRHSRAAESPEAVIVVVRARDAEQVDALRQLLVAAGGRDARVEPA